MGWALLIFFIVGTLIAVIGGFYVAKKDEPSKYKEVFDEEIQRLSEKFDKENQERIEEERKKVEESLKEYVNSCEIQR
ncbi:MAG: hypothetical protein IKU15_03030 [Clostridia bacterium]|nr:hypothetical protein [Clostridia bacterium]